MSTSTLEKTPDSSPPLTQSKQALEKKKLKVLKMALKEERVSKTNIEKELQAAYDKIEQLKQQITDKEQRYLQLYQENINLQEALVRESKDKKPKSSGPKAPLLGQTLSSKKDDKGALDLKDKDNKQSKNEALEMLKIKCNSQEELLMKKEDDMKALQLKVEQADSHMQRIQMLFNEKLEEIINERDLVLQTLKAKELEFTSAKQSLEEMMDTKVKELQARVLVLETESHELREQKNAEMDKNLKIEEVIDEKNERILQLEKEVLRKSDEVHLRKEVIDYMSQSLLNHEKESRELASKLVLMKNQILENDIGKLTDRRYAAIKLVNLKTPLPCSLHFVREKNEHYLIIDSKQFEMQINFESIESISETKDGKLNIIYYVPGSDGTGFQKKSETFECFEAEDVLKIYNNTRNHIETNDLKGMRVSQSFMGSAQFSKSKTQPSKKPRSSLI